MSWRRAAVLAAIPWALILAVLVPHQIWDGMAERYGWTSFTIRMISIAAFLYCAFTVALWSRERV